MVMDMLTYSLRNWIVKSEVVMKMSNTSVKTRVEWKDVNWQKLEKRVFKLQKRIDKASGRGDIKAVRQLQKILMRSWSAKMLAVRRVTQDNQGKKTAGVDGVKTLTPTERLNLVDNLQLGTKAKPTRRVWIPKPGMLKRDLWEYPPCMTAHYRHLSN